MSGVQELKVKAENGLEVAAELWAGVSHLLVVCVYREGRNIE